MVKLCLDATNTNCECYKKLRLAAVMVEAATILAAEIVAVAIMLAAIQW